MRENDNQTPAAEIKTVEAWGLAKNLLPRSTQVRPRKDGAVITVHNDSYWKYAAALAGQQALGLWMDPRATVSESEFDAAVTRWTVTETHR